MGFSATLWSFSALVLCVVHGFVLPPPDGRLHYYDLPTGQGDAKVIQCPSGELTVVDLGAEDYDDNWGPDDVWNFLQDQHHLIYNVLVTHNHDDHYNLLNKTFLTADHTPGLTNIYISCHPEQIQYEMKDWIDNIGGHDMLRMFNGGDTCGTNGVQCESLDLCPNDLEVLNEVMSVNYGEECTNPDAYLNPVSIVFKIIYGDVSILLAGDFEDFTADPEENGPQEAMVEYYGDELRSTVYSVAHHGGSGRSNKLPFLEAIQPKAVVISANPFHRWRVQECDTTDHFIYDVGSLCKPLEQPESEYYCGEHPDPSADSLQLMYWCIREGVDDPIVIDDNEWTVYTTFLDEATLNVIDVTTDGILWGVSNNYVPRNSN